MHINDTQETFKGVAGELFYDDETREEGGAYLYDPNNAEAWIDVEFEADIVADLVDMR